ncbi:ATP-dependent dethiobiotin synthetase BioD [Streptacidiphilus sp. PB12-B1b]|uniref:dethiobiotin synthase n=1 Tax=Streptacidiphilus sp. PB12-B1b TaxID=2705012 RepID=UPI0015F8F19B|nr:dethiobiotin synthase [Streptacidiphilus sp. PB12-B1b]QMU76232.1 ATP-dependent dethiobiotin synthetase BioD [Streptacidiphilus sp. PB12-B1b]
MATTGRVLLVSGTGTEIGKTVATAAVAALAVAEGLRVAVLKPAQTGLTPGEPGDAEQVRRLAGDAVTCSELGRFPEPLAPATAAARSGLPPVTPRQTALEAARLARTHDLVLVEGAGGLLVRFDADGGTLADVPAELRELGLEAPVLLVTTAGLGTLNTTALSAEALRTRGVRLLGLVIGAWPAEPDLASRCNLADLPLVADAPLLGALPERSAPGSGGTAADPAGARSAFLATARSALGQILVKIFE